MVIVVAIQQGDKQLATSSQIFLLLLLFFVLLPLHAVWRFSLHLLFSYLSPVSAEHSTSRLHLKCHMIVAT